jgi:putative tricarboxylic transport membrane protein
MSHRPDSNPAQRAIGIGLVVLGGLMAWGATGISSVAGYAGVGPNFLPWVVAVTLIVCGALLTWQSRGEGWSLGEASHGAAGDWQALAWVVAGVAANAALLLTLGFVLSCTLCFVLAVRGLRYSEGQPSRGVKGLVTDAFIGLCISAPVFWVFTKALSINLPGLTRTGWL